jgi:RNA-binding protein
MAELTPKQRQYLKGISHGEKSVIHIGKNGIDEGVIASINKALDDHELIKVSVLENSDLDRKEAAQEICDAVGAQIVQVLGRKITIYRKNKKESKIVLPK